MMKQGYTDINVVLDRSGSMETTRDDAIGGFNSFLKGQQQVDGVATISLVQFDDKYEPVYKGVNISVAPMLSRETFVPRGMTALYDAIGRTIVDMGQRYQLLPESERPEKVVLLIITDGNENASHEFSGMRIKEMLKHQQDKYNWQVVFIGANQDAIRSGTGMGISASNSMTYTANSQGTHLAYASLTRNLSSFRTGATSSMSFTEDDRKAQEEAAKTQ